MSKWIFGLSYGLRWRGETYKMKVEDEDKELGINFFIKRDWKYDLKFTGTKIDVKEPTWTTSADEVRHRTLSSQNWWKRLNFSIFFKDPIWFLLQYRGPQAYLSLNLNLFITWQIDEFLLDDCVKLFYTFVPEW